MFSDKNKREGGGAMYTILYVMIGVQLIVWAWFSLRGGVLPKKSFLIFTVGMMMGQTGAGIETFLTGAKGAFVIQVYFFIFTSIGGIKRLKEK